MYTLMGIMHINGLTLDRITLNTFSLKSQEVTLNPSIFHLEAQNGPEGPSRVNLGRLAGSHWSE